MKVIEYKMNRKSFQWGLLSIAILTLVIVNFILPTYEQIPYLERQINQATKEKNTIEKINRQLEYHLPVYETIKKKADKSIEIYDNIRWEKLILDQIGRSGLNLIKHSSDNPVNSAVTSELKIRLVMEGDYNAHIQFYKFINSIENQTIIRSYSLQNQNLFGKNPSLHGEMELSHYSINP